MLAISGGTALYKSRKLYEPFQVQVLTIYVRASFMNRQVVRLGLFHSIHVYTYTQRRSMDRMNQRSIGMCSRSYGQRYSKHQPHPDPVWPNKFSRLLAQNHARTVLASQVLQSFPLAHQCGSYGRVSSIHTSGSVVSKRVLTIRGGTDRSLVYIIYFTNHISACFGRPLDQKVNLQSAKLRVP